MFPIDMSLVTKKEKRLLVASAVSFCSGIALAAGTTGYLLAKKRLEPKYAALAAQEIEEAKQFYAVLHKKEAFATPQKAVETLRADVVDAAEALLKYQGQEPETEDPAVEEPEVDVAVEITANIFDKADDTFDIEEENKHRDHISPYVVSHEEFMENPLEHNQLTITYYAGDNTLADENDEPILDVKNVVGEQNLNRFGHGSGDPRVVYIRNERLGLDFEVVLSDGKFAHEVLGFLEHSDRPGSRKTRRFRGDDE